MKGLIHVEMRGEEGIRIIYVEVREGRKAYWDESGQAISTSNSGCHGDEILIQLQVWEQEKCVEVCPALFHSAMW